MVNFQQQYNNSQDLFLTKLLKTYIGKKTASSVSLTGKTGYSHVGNWNFTGISLYTQNSWKWVKGQDSLQTWTLVGSAFHTQTSYKDVIQLSALFFHICILIRIFLFFFYCLFVLKILDSFNSFSYSIWNSYCSDFLKFNYS
jgi:hypothetical protein